jgi:hypothetical protein
MMNRSQETCHETFAQSTHEDMGMMWILHANSPGMKACSMVMSAFVKHLPVERLGVLFCLKGGDA